MRAALLAAGIPLQAADVELSEPIETIAAGTAEDGTAYTAAVLLARLHGVPLGEVTVRLPSTTSAVVEALNDQLGLLDPLGTGGEVRTPARGGGAVTADGLDPPSGVEAGPSVSVVVATRHRPQQVARCVSALLASRYSDFEVIVVDNDPSDSRTEAALRPVLDSDRRLRYLGEPGRGASRARNTGIAAARGDVVAFTDDDVIVDQDWLPAMARTFAADPKVAGVTGLTLPYRLDTTAQRDFERLAGFSGGYRPLRFRLDMQPRPTRLFPFTPGIAGSSNNLAIRTEVLRRVGGFDVRLGPGTKVGGAEDLDLLTRVFLAGGEVCYEPSVLVRHEHRVEEGAVARQIFTYGSGATAILMKWALTSPVLRRQLAAHAWSIARDLTRVEVVRDKAGAHGEAVVPQANLQVARLLGYAAGPLLWVLTLLRRPRP